MKILVINGPNMNLLGMREPNIYGRDSYAELTDMIEFHAIELNIEVTCVQTNHEGVLVDIIQECYFNGTDGIVFNPAAYTHTSIAIADALKAVSIPTVEVHISDVAKREAFRQISYVRPYCVKTISGRGIEGYCEALEFLRKYINENNN